VKLRAVPLTFTFLGADASRTSVRSAPQGRDDGRADVRTGQNSGKNLGSFKRTRGAVIGIMILVPLPVATALVHMFGSAIQPSHARFTEGDQPGIVALDNGATRLVDSAYATTNQTFDQSR
jgi:hypothetical protein